MTGKEEVLNILAVIICCIQNQTALLDFQISSGPETQLERKGGKN